MKSVLTVPDVCEEVEAMLNEEEKDEWPEVEEIQSVKQFIAATAELEG